MTVVVVAKTCTGLPTITGGMENITANVGDDLDIEVYFCSRPLASASWIVR